MKSVVSWSINLSVRRTAHPPSQNTAIVASRIPHLPPLWVVPPFRATHPWTATRTDPPLSALPRKVLLAMTESGKDEMSHLVGAGKCSQVSNQC